MKRSHVFIITIFILITLSVLPVVQAQDGISPEITSQQKTILSHYLSNLGSNFDCYFTFEEAVSDSASKETFTRLYIEDLGLHSKAREEITSLEAELENLQHVVPYFTFQINATNPHIIHVIDSRLHQRKNYPFNSNLPHIKFHGTIVDLLIEINTQEPLIKRRTSFGSQESMFVDLGTRVKIEGTSLPIRDVLSNGITLNHRSRVLWIARTKLDSDQPSLIYYIK